MKLRQSLLLVCALILPLAVITGCGTEEDSQPQPVIKILEPKDGQTFTLSQTVLIIMESDYSRFSSGINVSFSSDSGKKWDLVLSKKAKSGVARDTVGWAPGLEGAVTAGQTIQFKAYDYGSAFSDISGFVHFTP